MADLLQVNLALRERLDKHGTRLYNLENLDIPHKGSATVDMKEILHQRMFEDYSYKTNNVHKDLYEALHKSLELDYSNQRLADREEARKKRRKRRDAPRSPPGSPPLQPPPPPPPAGASGTLGTEERSVTPEPTWTILPSNVSDVENNWASTLASSYEPPAENSLLAKTGDMMTFLNWYCRQINKSKLTQADLEGQAYEVVKVDWSNQEGRIKYNPVHRTSTLGMGLRVMSLFTTSSSIKQRSRYMRFSKGKHTGIVNLQDEGCSFYLTSVLKLQCQNRVIEDMCTYDISAKYGIVYWWFNRQKFYIDRHDFSLHLLKIVRTHYAVHIKCCPNQANSDDGSYRSFSVQTNGLLSMLLSYGDPKLSDSTRVLKIFNSKLKANRRRRLKDKKIYQILTCFVGGRVRDIDYRLLQRIE
ncbi:hypothetical protein Tco_0466573 [Tanacetum coccineum]